MRQLAIACALGGFACLAGAAYLPAPWWLVALYGAPLFGTWLVMVLAAGLLELRLGALFRSVAPVLAAAVAVFAVLFAIFERAPGSLGPGLPLQRLGDKALSITALGAALGGLPLGVFGLRAPHRGAQVLATLAVLGCVGALGTTARAAGLPSLSPWALGLVALAGCLFLLARPADPAEGDRAE